MYNVAWSDSDKKWDTTFFQDIHIVNLTKSNNSITDNIPAGLPKQITISYDNYVNDNCGYDPSTGRVLFLEGDGGGDGFVNNDSLYFIFQIGLGPSSDCYHGKK